MSDSQSTAILTLIKASKIFLWEVQLVELFNVAIGKLKPGTKSYNTTIVFLLPLKLWILLAWNVYSEFWLLGRKKCVATAIIHFYQHANSFRNEKIIKGADSNLLKRICNGDIQMHHRDVCFKSLDKVKREPWSSGYGKRLTFRRSWVRIVMMFIWKDRK